MRKDIFDKCFRNDTQRNLAVDATEREVVDLIAKRRDIRPLARVHVHRQHVLPIEIEVRRQIEGKRRVAALVFAKTHAIDPHCGSGHHAFKIDKDVMAGGFRRQPEAPPIDGDEFIQLFVKAMPRKTDVRVRHDNALESRVIKLARV